MPEALSALPGLSKFVSKTNQTFSKQKFTYNSHQGVRTCVYRSIYNGVDAVLGVFYDTYIT